MHLEGGFIIEQGVRTFLIGAEVTMTYWMSMAQPILLERSSLVEKEFLGLSGWLNYIINNYYKSYVMRTVLTWTFLLPLQLHRSSYLLSKIPLFFVLNFAHQRREGEKREGMQISKQNTRNL